MSGRNNLVNSIILAALSLLFLFGCATVKYDKIEISENANGEVEEIINENYGIRYYEAKPFLLVQYKSDGKGGKDAIPTLITLPDKTKPYKARLDGFLGNAEISLTLNNDVLVTTNGNYDTDDTITGLLAAIGTAAKVPTEIDKIKAEIDEINAGISKGRSAGFEVDCEKKYTGKWQMQMKAAETFLETAGSGTSDPNKEFRDNVIAEMQGWRKLICDSQEANLERNDLNVIERILSFQEALNEFRGKLAEIKKKLKKYTEAEACGENVNSSECISIAKSKNRIEWIEEDMDKYLPHNEVELPYFELYEIVYDGMGVFQGLKKRFP